MVDLANFGRYQKQNSNIAEAKTDIKAVFLGNSITEEWFDSDSAFFIKNQYIN